MRVNKLFESKFCSYISWVCTERTTSLKASHWNKAAMVLNPCLVGLKRVCSTSTWSWSWQSLWWNHFHRAKKRSEIIHPAYTRNIKKALWVIIGVNFILKVWCYWELSWILDFLCVSTFLLRRNDSEFWALDEIPIHIGASLAVGFGFRWVSIYLFCTWMVPDYPISWEGVVVPLGTLHTWSFSWVSLK